MSSSFHFSIGKAKRKELTDSAMNKVVPGPGAYNHSKFSSASKASPNWGFGSMSRP